MTPDPHTQQTESEAIDWLYCCLAGVLLGALIVASVVGHHVVSLGVMP